MVPSCQLLCTSRISVGFDIGDSHPAVASRPRSSSGSFSHVSISNSHRALAGRGSRHPGNSRVGKTIVGLKLFERWKSNRGVRIGSIRPSTAKSLSHLYADRMRWRRSSFVVCASSDERAAAIEEGTESALELPLFPLPLVLFPGAMLPLQIFEFRYRIMMNTLLQTDLRFGVVYADATAEMAGVGCVGEVMKHERLVDDRFFMVCKGQERFRVREIVRTKPYIVARVEWLEDRPSAEQEDLEALASEVEACMKDVIWLSNRVNGKTDKTAPEDLRKKLFPTPFSFWVASTFEGAPVEQQALLELEDTAQRLKREKETLKNTLSYLSAASAVKDAFPSTD